MANRCALLCCNNHLHNQQDATIPVYDKRDLDSKLIETLSRIESSIKDTMKMMERLCLQHDNRTRSTADLPTLDPETNIANDHDDRYDSDLSLASVEILISDDIPKLPESSNNLNY